MLFAQVSRAEDGAEVTRRAVHDHSEGGSRGFRVSGLGFRI